MINDASECDRTRFTERVINLEVVGPRTCRELVVAKWPGFIRVMTEIHLHLI